MKVKTTRFGDMEVDESTIIKMPRGPLGFEKYNEFFLIQHRNNSNLHWLQSTQEGSLAFVVVDPSEFVNDYEIEITDSDAEKIRLASPDDALVLTILTINSMSKQVTANLAAPIVVNSKELYGMQIVLQDNRYSVKQVLAANQLKKNEDKAMLKAA